MHLGPGTLSGKLASALWLQFLFNDDKMFPNSQPGVCKHLRPFRRVGARPGAGGWEGIDEQEESSEVTKGETAGECIQVPGFFVLLPVLLGTGWRGSQKGTKAVVDSSAGRK